MICENCQQEYTEIYGSGRFCSAKCARGFSTKNKRKEINEKVSKTLTGFKTIPGGKIKICDYGCKNEAKFQLSNDKWCCEDSYTKCPEIRRKNSKGVKKSHIGNKNAYFSKETRLKIIETKKEKLKQYYDSLPFNLKPQSEQKRIILNEQNNSCLICGINCWCGKQIIFHLDHIDGNKTNRERNNLRLICPNCHSQTDTYCGKNSNSGTVIVSDNIFIDQLKQSKNIHQALLKLGLTPKAGNYKRAYKLIEEHKLFE